MYSALLVGGVVCGRSVMYREMRNDFGTHMPTQFHGELKECRNTNKVGLPS